MALNLGFILKSFKKFIYIYDLLLSNRSLTDAEKMFFRPYIDATTTVVVSHVENSPAKVVPVC
jgi:hypothetical protein